MLHFWFLWLSTTTWALPILPQDSILITGLGKDSGVPFSGLSDSVDNVVGAIVNSKVKYLETN